MTLVTENSVLLQYTGQEMLIIPVRTFSYHYPFMRKSNTHGAEFKLILKIKMKDKIFKWKHRLKVKNL